MGPFADAVNTVISAVRGKWGEAAINAAAIVPIAGDTVKGAKIGADVAKASKIDRAAFQAERKAYWKAEAKTSADNYSAANLERMKSGKAPIGSDGHPMDASS